MKNFLSVFKQKNMTAGYIYFYIHMVTEIICFYSLSLIVGDSIILWLTPLIYDVLAFVPQAMIGYFSDKHPKVNFGVIGTIILTIGFMCFMLKTFSNPYLAIIIIALGNACIHVSGAEVTLRASNGKMSHSAIFVSGGSFGVILGKLIAKTDLSFYLLAILSLTMIPFAIIAQYYRESSKEQPLNNFNYANTKVNPYVLIFLATFIVIARGYVGYGIPTSWNKTVIQNIIFYFTMGIGKALGGILTDCIGMRKTAILSIIFSLPFLLFGDNIMLVSIIGVMLFSMTMAITLGLLVSVLKKAPGLAFGFTTIGLTLGTIPIFFFRITGFIPNCILLTIVAAICLTIALVIIRKDGVSNG